MGADRAGRGGTEREGSWLGQDQQSYLGCVCQLCHWHLQEEGAHDEVDFWDVHVVLQEVTQGAEPREQAGGLVGRRRVALQVVCWVEEAQWTTLVSASGQWGTGYGGEALSPACAIETLTRSACSQGSSAQ